MFYRLFGDGFCWGLTQLNLCAHLLNLRCLLFQAACDESIDFLLLLRAKAFML